MKIPTENMSPKEKKFHERRVSPLHAWTPHTDDRTGLSFCDVCVERELPWGQNKAVHAEYQIREETDLPWTK